MNNGIYARKVYSANRRNCQNHIRRLFMRRSRRAGLNLRTSQCPAVNRGTAQVGPSRITATIRRQIKRRAAVELDIILGHTVVGTAGREKEAVAIADRSAPNLVLVPTGNSSTDVLMVEAAENWPSSDASLILDRSPCGSVFGQRQVSAGAIVVIDVRSEDPSKMRLAQRDEVVEALATYRANEPLSVAILPW